MTAFQPSKALKTEEGNGVESRPFLRRIERADLMVLQKALLKTSRLDPYSQSASYYAMTGRKGLWLYSTDDTFMLLAAHPNRDDHLLLFPPIGRDPISLLKQAVCDDRLKAPIVQLARMSAQDRLLQNWAMASGQFTVESEALLDWTFPVHILSTQALMDRQGQRFRDFRKGILRAQRDGLRAAAVWDSSDIALLSKLARAWQKSTEHDGYSKDDLTTPITAVAQLMEFGELPLRALIIRKGDDPVGFIAWEETDPENRLANSLANVALDGKGTAEFSFLAMAESLLQRNFTQVCIGGSETFGLDQFKRKMNPVKSVPLQSAFSRGP